MDKLKKILWPVATGLFLALLALRFFGPTPIQERNTLAVQMESQSWKWFAKEKNLSEFAADLQAGKVQDLGIGIEYAFVNLEKDARYYLRIDTQRGLFLELLKDKKAATPPTIVSIGDISVPQTAIAKILQYVTLSNIMPLAMLALMMLVVVQMGLIDQSRKLFKRVQRPTLRFADVIGAEEAKDAVRDIVAFLKNPKQFSELGAKPPHGLILVGPPGTGKTLLAKALAGEAGGAYIPISGSDFSDKFVGAGIARVRKLFETARSLAPCVVFIDEIDSLGTRSANGDAVSTENNRIINAILVELDGFKPNDGVIVIGATNNLTLLDPALIREGRFDRTIALTLPTINEREALFELYASSLKRDGDFSPRQLARLSARLSPASIAGAVNSAALLAGKEAAPVVKQDHFMRALEQHRMGAPTESGRAAMSPDERRRIAVHEAGHALVTHVLNMGVLEKVSIMPRGEAGGVTWVTEEQDVSLYTEERLRKRLAVLLAGRAAESLLLQGTSTGAQNDLEHVTRIAHQMVTRYGFSKTLGALSYDGLPAEAQRGSVVAPEVLAETRAIIAEAEALTDATLTSHRKSLEAITESLLEKETISGATVQELVPTTESLARAA